MTQTITATVNSGSLARYVSAQAFGTTFSGAPSLSFTRNWLTTEITKLYFTNYTVTTTPTSIDLTALLDAYGQALSFTTLKHLQINNNDPTNALTVGGGTNGIFTTLPFTLVGFTAASGSTNGSCLNLTTNITVSGTTKILTLAASAGSISVDVFLMGS